MIQLSARISRIVLICFALQTAQAQQLPLENFNVNNGLSQSQVTSIAQDIRNYLWIGTAAGLNRFDGVHFTSFSKKDGINSNSITALYSSRKGDIWIGTTKGLSKYDGYRFQNLQTPEENPFVSFDAIAEDASGNIYAYSAWQGIFIVKGDKVIRLNTPEKNKPLPVYTATVRTACGCI